jgi:hypothetical protein
MWPADVDETNGNELRIAITRMKNRSPSRLLALHLTQV